ncbi:MAG: TolC family protein [Ignavibacteria bacterium]|nr:TolC family protein [Ignavibacteria bacterium]
MKIIFIYIIFISGILYGQTDSEEKSAEFGLNDLIKSALESNSQLEPIEFEKKILSAKIDQVNYQSSSFLQFMVDYIPVNFSSAGEYSLFYTQPIKLFGKLNAEEKLARTVSLKPEIEKKELENELIRAVKENYFMLSVNEKLLSFNKEYREIINTITSSIEIRYSAGKGNQYEIFKSNNEFQDLLLEEIELSNNKKILINNLRTLSNTELPENFRTKNIEILLKIEPPVLDSSKLFTELKSNNTDFKFIERLNEETKIEKNIAKLERKPDMELMTGYRYMSETKDNFILFAVSVDLPFMPWNEKRIDALINEKILMEKKLSSETNSLEVKLKNELKNNLVKINSSLEKIKYISEILIPQTEQTFKSILISYETASNEFMDLLDTYRSLRKNNKMLAEEEMNYLILISELEKLIGKQILTIN